MKTIRVREAKARDLGLFRKLQAEFSDDPDNANTLVKYEEETHEFFDSLFNMYVESDNGFVLFVGEWGMIVVGALRGEAKFQMGSVANVWFAYVSEEGRDAGIEEALFKEALSRVKDQGYNGITFGTPTVGQWTEVAESHGLSPFMLNYSREFDNVE
jgi:ribosomal protein S18 acetylase RimI-like enzyme